MAETVAVDAKLTREAETSATIEFTIPPEELEKAVEKTIAKIKKTQKIKGFRQGKVPKDVVVSLFGKDAINAEAMMELLPAAYTAAIRQVHAIPMDEPNFEDMPQIKDGEPLVIRAKLEVMPEVKLCDIDNIEVEVDDNVEMTEKDFEDAILTWRQERANVIPVEGRPSEPGDEITLDYRIAMPDGGELFEDKVDVRIILGRNLILPTIEEQITGMSAGEEKTISVSYPDNYQNEKLQGKSTDVTIRVKEIKARETPELTDELVMKDGYESLAHFHEAFRVQMLDMKRYFVEQQIRHAIVEKVLTQSEFTPPEKLVEQDKENNMAAFEDDLQRQGKELEDFLKENNLTFQQWRELEHNNAVRRVRAGVIIGDIFERNNLTIDRDDIGLELSRFSASHRITTADMKKLLKETDLHDRIILNLKERKVLDHLRLKTRCVGKKAEGENAPAAEQPAAAENAPEEK